jgi:hypothetical protein
MDSPDYGRPGAENPAARSTSSLSAFQRIDLGLEFEGEGLRAIVEVTKKR